MPLLALLTRPCTIRRRIASGASDAYGDEVITTTSVSALCELQQIRREEPGAMGELSDTAWRLFLPSETAIDTGDRVTVEGRDYELVGDPWIVRNPRNGLASHVEATLRRTAGQGATT